MKNFLRPFQYRIAPILFSIAVAIMPLHADDTMVQPTRKVETSQFHYLTGKKPDAIALLAPPPLANSLEQAADMDEVQKVYHAATSNDMAAAYSEKKFTVFNFTDAVGVYFTAANLPKTTAFFENVQKDAESITDNAKDFYKRPRPYVVDRSLANGKLEKSFSYPSGHSTESMVLALVLADLFPEQHDAIIALRLRAIIPRIFFPGVCWHKPSCAR
jgi:hypothetical protein